MGDILRFECGGCRYSKDYFVGGGFLSAFNRKVYDLYHCPECSDLCVRERTIGSEEEEKCESCGATMIPVKGKSGLSCPRCRGRDYALKNIGCWD